MAATVAVVVGEVGFPAILAETLAVFVAFFVAKFTQPYLAGGAVFLEQISDCYGLFLASHAVAEALEYESLVFYANNFLAGVALILFRFVFDSVVFDGAFGFAFGADDLVGGVVVVVHIFQKFFDEVGGHEGYVYLWIYDAFETVGFVVPVERVEL